MTKLNYEPKPTERELQARRWETVAMLVYCAVLALLAACAVIF